MVTAPRLNRPFTRSLGESSTMNAITKTHIPVGFWVAAALGLVWNLIGIVQFLSTTGATVDALVKTGMTMEQAQFYVKLPGWLHIAFAIGVFGGTVGCVLLLLGKSAADIVLWVALIVDVSRFALDAVLGVFRVMGTPQVVVLSFVVLIAAALCCLGSVSKRRGFLS